jgi:hypothetical protein
MYYVNKSAPADGGLDAEAAKSLGKSGCGNRARKVQGGPSDRNVCGVNECLR